MKSLETTELIYLVTGINFSFAPCAYGSKEQAIADIRIDYPNAGGVEVVMNSVQFALVRLGNGNLIAITAMRLYT